MARTSLANQLTNQILQFLYEQGAYGWRQNSGGVFDSKRAMFRASAKKGVSDILAVYKGQFIAVEVKIGKDRLSDEQTGFLKNIEHHGGLFFVAKDIDSFRSWWAEQYPS